VAEDLYSFSTPIYVTDHGGFSILSATAPDWNQTGESLDLAARASMEFITTTQF
jgi:hypothetical protein